MPASERYRRQAALLLQLIPFVALETDFALKGGTAINLFVRDMPRLSVDIDLTYVPIADRTASLSAIDAALQRIAQAIRRDMPRLRVTTGTLPNEPYVTKLYVRDVRDRALQVKVEVTPVLRGCVYDPAERPVSPAVEERLGYAAIQVVSFADLYAGKIVAALDRQHPRDLFDIQDLLAHEGITSDLRTAFIVYLVSHPRPMAEVLAPARIDLSTEFTRGFLGMTERSVTLEELLAVREALIATMVEGMPAHHRRFLLSVKQGRPDWSLLDVPAAAELPAVRWRLENLARLDRTKRAALIARLTSILAIT
jgi:hypothetical protein